MSVEVKEVSTDRKKLAQAFADHASGCDTCMGVVFDCLRTGKGRGDTAHRLCVVGRALDAADPITKGGPR